MPVDPITIPTVHSAAEIILALLKDILHIEQRETELHWQDYRKYPHIERIQTRSNLHCSIQKLELYGIGHEKEEQRNVC